MKNIKNSTNSTEKSPKEKTNHTLIVRLTDSQHQTVLDLQKAFGDISAAAVIRRALYELSENLQD